MVARIQSVRLGLLNAVAVSALAMPGMALAQGVPVPENEPATSAPSSEIDIADGEEASGEIVVTGFRASLESQTLAKRNSVGFTDSIFAEDIGKFPDTNIAESLNRIPGITIAREVTGEGSSVAIRGLGTNFTNE